MVKVLFQGNLDRYKKLLAAFNSEEVRIENRKLDNLAPGSAGILTDYDILAFDLEEPIYIHPIYYKKIWAFLNEKHGILLFILRQFTTTHITPPGQGKRQVNNHELILSLLKFTENNKNEMQFIPNPSYKLTPSSYGKNSVIKGYFEGDNYNIHIVVQEEKEQLVQSLAIDNEQNTVAFSIKPYASQIFVVPPKVDNELVELIEYVLPIIGKSQTDLGNIPDWVYNYTIPGLEKINEKIKTTEEKIEKLEKERESNKTEQKKL